MSIVDVDLPGADTGPQLPDDLWQARPVLGAIRQAAHSRARGADAVFGVTLARAAASLPPQVVLPPIVGAHGTINLLVALTGPPGAGKTTAAGVGADLLPITAPWALDGAVIGSGEGLIEAFMGTVETTDDEGKTRQIKAQVLRSMYCVVDEGQALMEQAGRRGATLLPTLRTAWSGTAPLGQANATAERTRRLDPYSYRIAAVLGFQPTTAAPLLADSAGGTPQRMLWLGTIDPSIPDDPPAWPDISLDEQIPHLRSDAARIEIEVAGPIAAEIRGVAIARARGELEVEALDEHRDLLRLKVAAILGVLDGRLSVTPDDWELAGITIDTSDRVRAQLLDTAQAAAVKAEQSRNETAARREAHLGMARADNALNRMARTIGRHVHSKAGTKHHDRGDGATCVRRCLTQATRSADRAEVPIDDAIDRAVFEGWILTDDGTTFTPGESRPR